MSTEEKKTWFVVKLEVDEPGLVGKAWWHEGLASSSSTSVNRRGCLVALGALGALVVLPRMCSAVFSDESFIEDSQAALELQKQHGWSIGADSVPLVMPATPGALNPGALARLVDELAPKSARLRPFYVPTLFESATSTQGSGPPLSAQLKPFRPQRVMDAEAQGTAFAAMADDMPGIAVVVNLNGPDAVGFAAGAAHAFDPVFLFDNWPHPNGVVPAHLTLAAAATFQGLFVDRKTSRPESAPPMFVVDRDRLATYVDEASQFDNRYVAKLPSADALSALGVTRVLYVAPSPGNESDDLNEDFVAYKARGIIVELIPADRFQRQEQVSGAGEPASYTGNTWGGYPYWVARSTFRARFLGADPARLAVPPHPSANEPKWAPQPRATAFSQGNPVAVPLHGRPARFGMVAVMLAASNRRFLGPKMDRSGSWNRVSSSYGGG